jgi:predicted nucleotidyltransferase
VGQGFLDKEGTVGSSPTLISQGMPEDSVTEAGAARLVTFGSYHLDVHSSESDVDALCVFPNKIDRSDFFDSLQQVLSDTPEVSHLTVRNFFQAELRGSFYVLGSFSLHSLALEFLGFLLMSVLVLEFIF